jgi:predicted AlkP superfamily phosphohydrolase/phosphomutase
MARTFVVGLDGAGWRLLDPWLDDGTLPNIERLREEGTVATSRSCLPPVTFPNWKCYSSGKNPGKHGVYWWERIDFEEQRIEVTSGEDYQTAELWDYLNAAGFTTGVVNMPSTYPPRPLDGVLVAGGPDAVGGEYRSLEEGYTYPAELETHLEREYDYRVHPKPLLSSNGERGDEVEEILSLLELRLRVALDLFEQREFDFMHVTLFYLNVLHHFFWDEEPTRRAWMLVDDWIGRLHEKEDVNLLVMSDHGSAATDTEFYINEWLAANGYLVRDRGIDEFLQRFGITRERMLSVAKRLRLVDALATVVPESLQKRVPQAAGAKRDRKMELIDPVESVALASGQGPLYLNPRHDTDAVRDQLRADLRTVTDADGTPLCTDIHDATDVYEGEYVDRGPELVLEQRPGVHVNDGLGGGTITTDPDRWAAENTREGIFLAAGPDFESAGDIGEISILDIAPTLLASYGVDLPTDLDQDPLDILRAEPDVGKQEPIVRDTTDGESTERELEERLKDLGYVE